MSARTNRRSFLKGSASCAAALWFCTAFGQKTTLPLREFLLVSEHYTAEKNLNPKLAQMYLEDLLKRDPQNEGYIKELATLIKTKQPLTSPGLGTLKKEIIKYWYTGTLLKSKTPTQLATYFDALCWKALSFTKPPGMCGGAIGYWRERLKTG